MSSRRKQCSHQPARKLEAFNWLAGYFKALAEAADLNFRCVQFIGGEPFLYPNIRQLVDRAMEYDFEFISWWIVDPSAVTAPIGANEDGGSDYRAAGQASPSALSGHSVFKFHACFRGQSAMVPEIPRFLSIVQSFEMLWGRVVMLSRLSGRMSTGVFGRAGS
jgi:hypothetical protein